MKTIEKISVNKYGEFDKGCICGGNDWFTVRKEGGWHEIEPVIEWHGWGCVECNRVFNDKGEVIAHPKTIKWLY